MDVRKRVLWSVVLILFLGILLVLVQARRNTAPLLTIHVKSAPPVHLFTNVAPEIVKKHLSNGYQVFPLELKSVTNITEADIEQLRNAVEGKSPFSAWCSAIEFIDPKQAIVSARTVLGGERNHLFRKSDSGWELIHQRSGRE